MPASPDTLVAIDTGGTFTDLVLADAHGVRCAKVPSTPDDPARAILAGLEQLGARGARVVHGTTVGTNAVLERRGARTGFVTNEGFRDLLVIGRQNRPALYALRVERPEPLVARADVLTVPGRLSARGEVLEPLAQADVDALVAAMAAAAGDGVEAVAICLLHSYADPAHEAALAAALRDALPELRVSVSSELLPLFREYERAVATTLNAYVQPVMARYLGRLGAALGEELLINQSDGGTVRAAEAAEEPVRTLLSGPAGGVLGALEAGRGAGRTRLIGFDMGGTSTDVALVDGAPSYTREGTIGGLPLPVRTIDIHTVGAGGGSVAWLDAGGALKVGPHSAGAAPGPACYGRGEEPTVTDADVVLGRLPSGVPLAGSLALDRARAVAAVHRIAEPLGVSVEEAAAGIVAVAEARMVRAIKVISLERGHDPRDFTLVAFGGAGALHACGVAEALEMRAVLVPVAPGLLSAVGMLSADCSRELVAATMETIPAGAALEPDRLAAALAPLRAQGAAFLDSQGVADADRAYEGRVALRYRGQSFELDVPAEGDVIARFHERHAWRYGYDLRERDVEWVAVGLRALGRRPKVAVPATAGAPSRSPGASTNWGHACAEVFWRDELAPGETRRGPLVVAELSATTWVAPGWRLTVEPGGALLLEAEAAP
jgi:N-methylhydantoinase A